MNVQSTEILGKAIRARRKSLGVTQKDLALVSGTGLRFISDLEQGKATCQIGKAIVVVRSLGMSMEIDSP